MHRPASRLGCHHADHRDDSTIQLIDIPRLEKRLELFQWKLQLDPTVAETLKSLATLSTACDEVKASKRLPVLLKAILLIGQVLNRDSYLFNSDGFRVESLMKVRSFLPRRDSLLP